MKYMKHRYSSKILAVIMICIMIAGCLSISALAYTDISTNGVNFDNANVPIYTTSNYQEAYNTSLKVANGAGVYVYYGDNSNVYAFWLKNGDTYTLGIASTEAIYVRKILSNLNFTVASDTTPNDGMYNVSFNDIYISNDYADVLPQFDSYADGIAAVKDWIENPPAVGPGPQPLNISLPAGNAIYIDITGLSPSATLSTSTPNRYYSSPHSGNQTLSYTDTIVSSGSSIPGNPISWQGSGNTDLLGRYRSWSSTLIVQPGKKYIAIFCNQSAMLLAV